MGKDIVYLILKGIAMTLDSESDVNEGYGYGGQIEEEVKGVLASVLCRKCNSPNVILSLDGAEVVETEPREMGMEHYFICEYWGNCENCAAEIRIKYEFNEYAFGWCYIEAEEQENCEPYFVDGLKSVAERIAKLLDKPSEEEASWEDVIRGEKTKCRVLVEGRDNYSVLKEFFGKTNLTDDDLIIVGVEGIDELTKRIKELRIMEVPFPLVFVADSDSNRDKRIETLKKAGAQQEEIYVWPKINIDAYLMEPRALAGLLRISEEEIREFCHLNQEMNPKELLNALFKEYGLREPNSDVKRLIVRQMDKVPDDVQTLSEIVRKKMYP